MPVTTKTAQRLTPMEMAKAAIVERMMPSSRVYFTLQIAHSR